MVADGGSVVAHLVHQTYLHLALEERIITRPLREVARVEEQEVRILLALFLDHADTTEEACTPCDILVLEVRVEGHDRRVGIVGVQNNELLLLLGISI